MNDINQLDELYKKYIKDLTTWLPEGIIEVDLKLMQEMDLLDYHRTEKKDPSLTRYFHVVESAEKITLINDHFVIWIVPDKVNDNPVTYTLIALNFPDIPRLEMAFASRGVYNTSRLVLRVLEKYLQEIQDTEDLLHKLKKTA